MELFTIIALLIIMIAFFINYYPTLQKFLGLKRLEQRFITINELQRPVVDEICKGMTLDDYIKYEKEEKSSIAKFVYEFSEHQNPQIELFEFKVMHLWDCIENMEEKQNEILNLWKELYTLVPTYEKIRDMKSILGILAYITYESHLSYRVRGQLDDKLIDAVMERFEIDFNNKKFTDVIEEVIDWYYFKVESYYKNLKVATTETELRYLEVYYNRYEEEFEKLKAEYPSVFLKYTGCVFYFYVNLPDRLDRNYDDFFRYVMLGRIAVSRNIGDLELMSESIYLFKKQVAKKSVGLKKIGYWIVDTFAGYGEKPFRLLKAYLILQVFFFFVMFPYEGTVVSLKGLESTQDLMDKIINTIYFNSTTMLTSVYGDISPSNTVSRLIIVVEQILGFIVCGSFVALVLRKLFRF
ncbi:potassium channel family protein [Ammoniphilus sp. 3BR4]|uniref:potassium channel family protein n=1 Tax=Ammoniphilus sp. 3BR4 TaxID=3158265 RepID=UPI003466BEBE